MVIADNTPWATLVRQFKEPTITFDSREVNITVYDDYIQENVIEEEDYYVKERGVYIHAWGDTYYPG